MDELPNDLAIPAAVHWLESALLGSVATLIATIAVASLGYLALTGRVDVRRAAQVVLGCFILFGAPSIASGLRTIASEIVGEAPTLPQETSLPAKVDLKAALPQPPAVPYDPYAGAALAPK